MGVANWDLFSGVGLVLGQISESFHREGSHERRTRQVAALDSHGKSHLLKIRASISVALALILIILPQSVLSLLSTPPHSGALAPAPRLAGRAPNGSAPLLDVIQVSPPVLTPGSPSCQQVLMIHSFGWSYGKPFVGDYVPPSCNFNRVTFNLTVTSAGRQYDRLALMFFNDTEIFRTSTAEPTQSGIIWTYIKDMSNFLTMFKQPQKIIFDLGNLVDDTYTGAFNTTLTATFFSAESHIPQADVIIPVSARQSASNSPSGFVVPEQKAINSLVLPQNVKKAVFSVSACGQATEEFWWANVLSSDTNTFGNETTLYGFSPFRELQLLIDGTLAGVVWPFPIIFTGGVIPGLWRPVVGIDAFDLREDEIDITPFLPILSDGKEHTFEIRVAGISDDGTGRGELTQTVGSNWVVTGKIFLWLDAAGHITTGTVAVMTAPNPSLQLHSSVARGQNTTNTTLDYSVKVQRSLSIISTVTTSSGSELVTWQQDLSFSNDGKVTNGGNDQINDQRTSGTVMSSLGYSKQFSYPLWVYSSYSILAGGNFTIDGTMRRGKDVRQTGALAFPSDIQTFDSGRSLDHHPPYFAGMSSSNHQNGTAHYLGAPAQKRSYGSGTTEQYLSLSGINPSDATVQIVAAPTIAGVEVYRRHVLAANDTILLDEENAGRQTTHTEQFGTQAERQTFARVGIKAILGRGPF